MFNFCYIPVTRLECSDGKIARSSGGTRPWKLKEGYGYDFKTKPEVNRLSVWCNGVILNNFYFGWPSFRVTEPGGFRLHGGWFRFKSSDDVRCLSPVPETGWILLETFTLHMEEGLWSIQSKWVRYNSFCFSPPLQQPMIETTHESLTTRYKTKNVAHLHWFLLENV